jgi:16S rRNA (cytosine1402-N4)-methyltransferase
VTRVLAPSTPTTTSWVIRSPLAGATDGSTLSAYGTHSPLSPHPRYTDAGGLRMTQDDLGAPESFSHTPVMLQEVVDLLTATPGGVWVDATVGGGGHAAALLAASPYHRLIGLDRDPEAVAAASDALAGFGARALVVHARFDRIAEVLESAAPGEPVTGVFFDLGVSSRQFDEAGRGFSYRYDAPLDMRMDATSGITAADLLDELPEDALARIFVDNGERRFARRIARAIVKQRPVTSTGQLADIVKYALPAAARHHGGHPAKRVFQALRIAVNEELDLLGPALDEAMSLLVPGGRCVVLAYHSGEDRMVKDHFRAAAAGWCKCSPDLPCVCGAVPAVHLLNRGARLASAAEQTANPRSASARLRAVERLDAPFGNSRRLAGEASEEQ